MGVALELHLRNLNIKLRIFRTSVIIQTFNFLKTDWSITFKMTLQEIAESILFDLFYLSTFKGKRYVNRSCPRFSYEEDRDLVGTKDC